MMADDAIVPLMRALVAGIDESAAKRGDPVPEDWASFSVVVELKSDGRYASSSGYAYGKDDAWVKAISASPMTIKDALADFVAERYPNDAKPALQILFQLELATGNYNVEYEDTDSSRWAVTPANYREMQAELKPVFEA